jgi:hypothetical protein
MRTIEMRGNYVFNAYRQVWLASLGAAVVTRDWAQSEAAPLFRNLVKEGTLVESRTFRIVGDRIEGSVASANAVWKRARSTMRETVRQAADTAVTLVQNNLPKSLPKVTLPSMLAPAKPAKKRAAKAVRNAKVRKTVKRAGKRTKARTAK